MKAEKRITTKKTKLNGDECVPGKLVKFKKVNHSKSYKASMKGLRNAEMDLSRTPEKGILLKKLEYKSISSESKNLTGRKTKRKKAKEFDLRLDWIMEVVNLRCDGHYSGSNPDRRVKPASCVIVVYDFILYEFSNLLYSLIISISLSSLIFSITVSSLS